MQDMCIHHRRSLPHFFVRLVLLLVSLIGMCSAREKKDIIQFTNGDRITCEIIKLEKGYLYVKLDYADGTVAMDWSKIARVESPQSFVVADKAGRRDTGSLQSAVQGKAPEELKVQVAGTFREPDALGQRSGWNQPNRHQLLAEPARCDGCWVQFHEAGKPHAVQL